MRKAALLLVCGALALGIRPDPEIAPSAWAAKHVIVADGPQEGELWDPDLTPFWPEVLDCLAPHAPHNRVVVRKSAQVGATMVGIAWTLYVGSVAPTTMLTVFPTESLAKDWAGEKLQPSIDKCDAAKGRIMDPRSRSTDGSTVLRKRFLGGGFDAITGATSAPGLRARTVRYLYAEEIDDWPRDVGGQGDPMRMARARYKAFLASGTYKHLDVSTPTVKGSSRIDAGYEGGDQRVWEMPCPHCGSYQVLEWQRLAFEGAQPYRAHYVCAANGCVIEHSAKRDMLSKGRWRATNPGPGRYPSFHIDALSSPFVTWDQLAAEWWDSQGDPEALKAFDNLTLGKSFDVKGDAPDAELLYERRRGEYRRNSLPEGVLFLTAGVDVQGDRLELEVVGWGLGQRSWSIDYRVLSGSTDQMAVWGQLGEVLRETWTDVRDNPRQVEVACIDTGYRPDMGYAFCAGRPFAIPIKGTGSEGAGIIVPGRAQSFTIKGRAKKGSVRVWHVGTWSLKAALYGQLAIERTAGEPWPMGYCSFPEDYAKDYFQQLTAESLVGRPVRGGRLVYEWIKSPRVPNEALDCRVYARAAAEHPVMRARGLKPMGLMTPSDWAALSAARGAPAEPDQLDLLTSAMGSPAAGGSTRAPPPGPSGEARREAASPAARRAPEGGGRGTVAGRGVAGGGRGVA